MLTLLTRRWKPAESARTLVTLLAVTLILTCLASTAFGQLTTTSTRDSKDSYYSGFFANAHMAGLPSGEVDIVNTGSLAGYSHLDFAGHYPFGDLCANIYVYSGDQTFVECCSCLITPNALLQLSVDTDLTLNPANGVIPGAGVIKIVSSYADKDGCTVSRSVGSLTSTIDVAATDYEPTGSLRSWVTHPRALSAGVLTVNETEFHIGFLSERNNYGMGETVESDRHGSERSKLQSDCFAAQTNQSGKGRCTCNGGPK